MRTQGHSKQQVGTDDDEVKRPPMPSSEAGRDGSQAVPEARSKDSTESRAAFIEHQAVHSGAFPAESTPPDVTYKSPRLAWIAPHLHVHAMASLTGDSTPTYHEELVVAGGNSPLVSDSIATRNESSDRYSRSITSDSFNSMAYRGDRASQPSRDKSAATSMSGTRRDRWREGDEYGDNRSYDDHEESLSLQVGAIAVNGIGARNPSGANDNFPSFDDDTEPATDTTDPVTSDVGKAVGLATAILVSEDDRTMMHQLDPTGPYYAAEEIHEEEVEKGFDGFLRRNSLKICLCVVVLVIGSILGSIFSLRTSMAEEQFDAEALVLKAGSPRFRDAAKRLLRQNVTGREVLLNAPLKTPQYIALEWLADKDQAQIDLSNDVLLIQRYSLAVLFFSSGGDSWTDTLNFTSARNECEWYSMEKDIRHGVAECSEDGAVTQLWLNDNNLKGTLPNELGQLTLLKTLSLKDNRLSGRIPETVGVQGLDVLTVLDVSGNILSGTLPKTFSQNLSELHLNDNLLTGEVPSSIGELVNIQYLGLYNNSLSGKLLEQPFLYKMTGLSSLELGDNLFSGTISTDIVMLTKLKTLNLGHQVSLKSTHSTAEEQARRFIGTIPTELGRLSNLEWVNLSGNRLTGSIPTEIAELPLHTLALNHNELTGTFPVELALLSNIVTLSLQGNSITGSLESFCTQFVGWDKDHVSDCLEDTVTCSCCTECCNKTDYCSKM